MRVSAEAPRRQRSRRSRGCSPLSRGRPRHLSRSRCVRAGARVGGGPRLTRYRTRTGDPTQTQYVSLELGQATGRKIGAHLLELQVDQDRDGGEPVEDVRQNRAHWRERSAFCNNQDACMNLREALFVQPKMAPKMDHPWPSPTFSGLQQSRCQTLPATRNEPGPSPPASSTSAPSLLRIGIT